MAQCHYSQRQASEDGNENLDFPKPETGMVQGALRVNRRPIKVIKTQGSRGEGGWPQKPSHCAQYKPSHL